MTIFLFVSICQNYFTVVVLCVKHLFVPEVTTYSGQDLNKLLSLFIYVNKFPNTFKQLQNKQTNKQKKSLLEA